MFSIKALLIMSLLFFGAPSLEFQEAPEGWLIAAPRDEVSPKFGFVPDGGKDRNGAFIIVSDARPELDGYWTKSFPVTGGKSYRFFALRRTTEIEAPERSVYAQVFWKGEKGKRITVKPEQPKIRSTDVDRWTEISDTMKAPPTAAQAVIELHLHHAPNGSVEWCSVSFTEYHERKNDR